MCCVKSRRTGSPRRSPGITCKIEPSDHPKAWGMSVMDLEALLRDVIKPELNRIYTEPPSALHGGADMGLFCREHAFHCAVLCILLGFPAAIKRGDFSAILDEDTGVTSY